jgi:hypothetical protein
MESFINLLTRWFLGAIAIFFFWVWLTFIGTMAARMGLPPLPMPGGNASPAFVGAFIFFSLSIFLFICWIVGAAILGDE